jgi:hypothetical protein
MKKSSWIVIAFVIVHITSNPLNAQQDNSLHLTTGVGINKVLGESGKTFRSTIAFNSGFEKSFKKNWYGQLELNFNSLRYDQQLKDDNSPYLFKNTNSSLFLIGVNWGHDFTFNNSPWFTSAYAGTGYLNIGEPRVNLDEVNSIITQSVVRKSGIIGKAGGRIGVKTNSAFFQTVYLDGSYFTSSIKAEGSIFRTVSFFLGIKMAMTGSDNVIRKQMKTIRRIK